MKKILPKLAAAACLSFVLLCNIAVTNSAFAQAGAGQTNTGAGGAGQTNTGAGGAGQTNTGTGQTNTGAGQTNATNLNTGFQLDNPLSVGTIQELMEKVLNAVVLILTPVIVIMLIYSGFLFVTSQTSENGLKKAKDTFKYTLIGAAIIIGAKGLAMALANTISQF